MFEVLNSNRCRRVFHSADGWLNGVALRGALTHSVWLSRPPHAARAAVMVSYARRISWVLREAIRSASSGSPRETSLSG